MINQRRINSYIKRGKVKKLRELTVFNKSKSVRLAAIDGLGQLAENELSVNGLVALLGDRDVDIRLEAASALGNSKSTYAQVRLSCFCEDEQNDKVLQAARLSLEKMKETSDTTTFV